MGKVTQARGHVSADELAARIDRCKDGWHARKLLVVWNATVDPRPAEEIAIHCEVAPQTVHNWISRYNRFGLDALCGPGKGGRRNELMSLEEGKEFLTPFFGRAKKGQIATVAKIKSVLEEHVGHSIGH
jgi:transposase